MTVIHVVALILAYWALALIATRAFYRRRTRSVRPVAYDQISDSEYVVTYEGKIRIGTLVTVAFGPPLIIVLAGLLF